MGLDISAYRGMTWKMDGSEENEDAACEQGLEYIWDTGRRGDGLKPGYYAVRESMGFRAGSYGGYNRWREILSKAVLGVVPDAVWDDPDAYAGKPCVELINFSDCEGTIGPKTSAKLAADLKANRERFVAANDGPGWFVETYDSFVKAFDMASDDGAVSFH